MSALTVSSQSSGIIAQTISASASSLYPPLVNLVKQYLFPEPKEWITEWTAEHGREIIAHAIEASDTSLAPNCLWLVVDYLKKSDIFGLPQLEAAYGKKNLEKEFWGYGPEPLPFDIDGDMQTDLGKIFDAETVQDLAPHAKATELFSLYYNFAELTANAAHALAQKKKEKFQQDSSQKVLEQYGDTSHDEADGWLLCSNQLLGRSKTYAEQQALVPAGYEIPHLSNAVFCIFTKYLCTKTRLCPWDYSTRCQEIYNGGVAATGSVIVGGYANYGLEVNFATHAKTPWLGILVLRKL